MHRRVFPRNGTSILLLLLRFLLFHHPCSIMPSHLWRWTYHCSSHVCWGFPFRGAVMVRSHRVRKSPRFVRTIQGHFLSSMSLAHQGKDDSYRIDDEEDDDPSSSSATTNVLLETLQAEIMSINGGQWINCNSPRQVAAAIFGHSSGSSSSSSLQPSTNQRFLRKVARGERTDFPVDQRGQKLAALVLQYRSLQRSSSAAAAGGKNIGEEEEENEEEVIKENRNEDNKAIHNDVGDWGSSVTPPLVELDIPSEVVRPGVVDESSAEEKLTPIIVHHRRNDESHSYQSLVERMFQHPGCQIHDYWKDALLQLSRPSAQTLVLQLDSEQCPMGYDPLAVPSMDSFSFRSVVSESVVTPSTQAGKKGSFLAFCREQKEKYPDCVILTRCGDFYETFGIDAILLVEHCGLNAMGSKAKAGCPIRNVQATLDGLTAAGFRVAVYEEGADTDALTVRSTAGSKSRIKSRFLAQIVSSAAPTYLYDLLLLDNASDALAAGPISRPYIGILSSLAGYTLTEVSMEERTVRVSERLTPEAVACRLAAGPPADPLFYVPSSNEYEAGGSNPTAALALPFLPSRRDVNNYGPGGRIRTKILPPSLVLQHGDNGSDVERAKKIIVSALLELTECQDDDDETSSRPRATVDDFTIVTEEDVSSDGTPTNALYLETATQLGLMNDGAIPSLVPFLVADSAPAATRRFLRRLLLTPPPPAVSGALSTLVVLLMRDDGPALPPLSVPPLGKVLAMIRAGQASAQIYAELLHTLNSTILILDLFSDQCGPEMNESASMTSLMTLLEYESGMAADPVSLKRRCCEAIATIEAVLCPMYHVSGRSFGTLDVAAKDDYCLSECSPLIPRAFLERNEAIWRGRVRKESAPNAYKNVQESAERLARAVDLDFSSDGNKTLVVQDVFNNLIALKEKPSTTRDDVKYIHPKDRFGKTLGNRYTTELVESALSNYVAACDKASADVSKALVALSHSLHDSGHIPAVVQASHANLILATAFYHATKATSLGWSMAETVEPNPEVDCAGHFQGVWPYWMERSEAVKNTFDLSGMWTLTAPNMSGKSTIMRSTAAAALLTVCGLCAPLLPGSKIRRFDHIFVRGASSDIPSEQKSAFGAEMADVAALFRCCTNKSLVFVDELGRGTSPRDGTRLSGAVLEAMAGAGMSGIFATHLHDIFKLPLQSKSRIVQKRMAIHERNFDGEEYTWTYRLEDGVCNDSLALITAKKFGIPGHVLQRAEVLSAFLPSSSGPEQSVNEVTVHNMYPEFSVTPNISHIIETTTGQRVVEVPPGWSAPAAYNGKSVVYVLKLNTNPTRFYVGESDNVRKRIEKHRTKGEAYSNAIAFISLAPRGKSQARMWEYRLIRKMASSGFLLDSVADGRTIRAISYENLVED